MRISGNGRFFLLIILPLLLLISAESFCSDIDLSDNNSVEDFSCQYPDIVYQHYDQVAFISGGSSFHKLPSLQRSPLLSRSPPQ